MKRLYSILLGLLLPFAGHASNPITLSATTEAEFNEWTVVDVNNDGRTWAFSSALSAARYMYTSLNAADDYLISKDVQLEGGKIYEIEGYVSKAYAKYAEYIMFTVGQGKTVEAQSTILLDKTEVSSTSFTTYTATFVPTESGEYNFAIKAASDESGRAIYFQKFEITEKVELPGTITDYSVTPGDKGAISAVLKWKWPTLNTVGTELKTAIKGAKIYRTNSTGSVSDKNLVKTIEGDNFKAGEEYTYTDEAPASGTYYYYVRVVGENGDAPSYYPTTYKNAKVWVGPDEVTSLSNLEATASDDASEVTLTWSGPAKNGGYIDMTNAGYKITRKSPSYGTETVLEENWKGASPYIDSNITVLDQYTYTVTFTHPDLSSASSANVSVIAGTKGALPYSNNLTYSDESTTVNGAELITTFHVEGSYDWNKNSTGIYISKEGTNAWFATPAFSFEPGKVYELTFKTKTYSSTYPRDLAVYIGKNVCQDNLPEKSLFSETITTSSFVTKTVYFSVDEAGEYNIAFNGKASSGSSSLYIKNLSIKEINITPGTATDLTATAGEAGALTAHLSWMNPAIDNTDNELAAFYHIDVLRGETVVKSFTEVDSGKAMTYDDTVAVAGNYTYSIVSYFGNNAGEAATTSLWVGKDTPAAPKNVVATAANGVATITWDAVTEGVNGGYVDATAVTYNVTRNGEGVATGLPGTTYTEDGASLDLASYVYKVTAVYDGQESDATATDAVVLGGALNLPYEPSFASADAFELWTLDGWSYESTSSALKASDTESWAFTPPFKVKNGSISVTFGYKANTSDSPVKMYVYLATATEKDAESAALTLLCDETSETDCFSTTSTLGETSSVATNVAEGTYYIAFRSVENSTNNFITDLSIVQDIETGIESIESVEAEANDADAHFYNIQGIEVKGDHTPGIYIVKRGNTTEKLLVK
jgi:hypothetical protein